MNLGLSSLLAELEQRLRDFGAPITEAFRPGLAPERVAEELAREGLAPHVDLLVWWGWHDGAEIDAPPLEPGPSIYLRAENTLLGPWHLLSLAEAVRVRRWLRETHDAAGIGGVFPASWVPVLVTDGGGELCAD